MTVPPNPFAAAPTDAGTPPSPEEVTAGTLYRLAEALALSDEPGATAQAWDVACRADALARIEIGRRTDGYCEAKAGIDEALSLMAARSADLDRVRGLVATARDVVGMVDNLLLLAAEPFA